MSYLYLAIAIACEVVATSALKASQGFTVPIPSIITVVGYAVAFYLLSLTLKTIPIGIAYAIWSGAGIILISAIGWIFYKQHLDLAACIGLALMIAGIVIINVFSKNTHL
ncbi:multidrug efflux SMR transporter AbeS [Acinetobacter baumannii]|uniref:multidrug efflux SMR transporter AbeS n=1 Tax=Acinetobacter baumannii TaxID=470 RepID=UPI001F358BF1|nr:multidrug efflux SMR transporter AbeS [Acinetobacter baumannii]MCF1331798.1 multidrug efflux SMR transporter AbeS [Acinetobacter baumannii]